MIFFMIKNYLNKEQEQEQEQVRTILVTKYHSAQSEEEIECNKAKTLLP